MLGRAVFLVALAACGRLRFDARDDSGGDVASDAADLCGFHGIDAGNSIACAIDKDGAVWCWGSNSAQAITLGSMEPVLSPVKLALPGAATKVRTGSASTCALLADGRVFCGGQNDKGQAGNNTTGVATGPVQVQLGADTAIDLDVGGNHACIRRASDLAVMCWGENKSFALANGGPGTQAAPTLVANSAGAKALALGHRHGCYIDAQDHPVCWGRQRAEARLGNGGTADQQMPMAITAVPNATAVAGGNRLTCIVATGGATRCFGERYLGGAAFDSYDASVVVADGVEVAAGAHQGCARRSDGTVSCWGYVSIDGRTDLSTTAVPTSLTNVTELSGTWNHTCAIANGRAVCRGDNSSGALGRGFNNVVATPQVVPLPSPVTAIAAVRCCAGATA